MCTTQVIFLVVVRPHPGLGKARGVSSRMLGAGWDNQAPRSPLRLHHPDGDMAGQGDAAALMVGSTSWQLLNLGSAFRFLLRSAETIKCSWEAAEPHQELTVVETQALLRGVGRVELNVFICHRVDHHHT